MIKRKQKNHKTGYKKISTKISFILTITLVCIFSVQILFSVMLAENSLEKALNKNFSSMATQSSDRVQRILDATLIDTKKLAGYIGGVYEENNQTFADNSTATKHSVAYDIELNEVAATIENYIINTAWATVGNEIDIVGMGIYFEPYIFSPMLEEYAVYTSKEDEQNKTVQTYENYFQEEYYKVPIMEQKPVFSNPYQDQGMMMITISYPIIASGQVIGVVTGDINISDFGSMIQIDENFPTMFATITTNEGVFVYDSSNNDAVGQNISEYNGQEDMEVMNENFAHGTAYRVNTTIMKDGESVEIARYFSPIEVAGKTWWSQSALEMQDLNKDVYQLRLFMTTISIIALMAIVVVIAYFVKKLLKPITVVQEAAKNISKGVFTFENPHISNDELGQLSQSMKTLTSTTKFIIEDMDMRLSEFAKGNFLIQSKKEDNYIGIYKPLNIVMDKIASQLSYTMNNIQNASLQVKLSSEEVSKSSQILAMGSIEQGKSIEELSQTVVHISEKIKVTANNSMMAKTNTENMNIGIDLGNRKTEEMICAISQINDKSGEIGKIIKIIEDIAFQTNILALNASIEAARAGVAGKGFAVVADEVRNLAQKSSEAARNITTLIQDAIDAVNNGTTIAKENSEAMGAIVTCATEVGDMVESITLSLEEQALSIVKINSGVLQIATVMETNSAISEESSANSQELMVQANLLKELASKFQLKKL